MAYYGSLLRNETVPFVEKFQANLDLRPKDRDKNNNEVANTLYYNAEQGEIMFHNLILCDTLGEEMDAWENYKHEYLYKNKLQR